MGKTRSMLVDGVGDVMNETAAAVADGSPALLAKALHRSSTAGASPIGLLRVLQRTFLRLHTAQNHIANGDAPASAMKRLKPPVFYMEQKPFEQRLRNWSLKRLELALDMLVEAEFAAKTTGSPQKEIVERTALRLSHMAKK